VVIEDAYKGVLAAHRSGCKCIAVPHAFTTDNDFTLANVIVPSLDAVTVALVEQTTGLTPA
jgi:beta-phosphoglucomutase-like phosphatase (HAD superfamily)